MDELWMAEDPKGYRIAQLEAALREARAESERLREALRAARAWIDVEAYDAVEAALNADRAASVIDAALSEGEDR